MNRTDQKAKGKTINHNQEFPTMIYGKVPPCAVDLEETVLGAILLETGAIFEAQEYLNEKSFYKDSHQRIFKAMVDLQIKGSPIDIHTVSERLQAKEELDIIGGRYFISKLTTSVVSSANIQAHCKIILEKYIQREIIRIGSEMVQSGYQDSTDVFDLLDHTEECVYNITLNNLKKDYSSIDVGLVKAVQRIEELRHKEQSLTGVPSGFKDLDRTTHGWQPTDLIILAARPSVGKTAFALNLARNAALDLHKPTPVAIFSLEMSMQQLIQRVLSAESEIWLERIKNGRLEEAQMAQLYQRGIQKLAQAPIYIDDTPGLNMFELRAKARRMKNKNNIGLIIIDYLQLMSGDSNKSENREREISKISRELKKLAKDIQVPIIALSQLSREVEKRQKGHKVPQLSDLRESGAIEQDADLVMFLYRPPEDEVREDPELKNKGMVKIAKHRDGVLGEIIFKFYGEIQKWMELNDANGYEMRSHGMLPLSKDSGGNLYVRDFTEPSKIENLEEDPF